MSYKIHVVDRQYKKWDIFNSNTLELSKLNFDPVKNKLFNHDVFSINGEKVNIIHSAIREIPSIQGVLVLEGNKTYGYHSKNRLYYRCIPDDRRLPEFLVPYKLKIGFIKKMTNKYIIFKYKNWDNKHPTGTIIQTIGPVDDLTSFYEYQLYCKSLYASIQQFTKNTMRALRDKSRDFYINSILKTYQLENRQNWDIYSIDPENSRDLDDAFSIKSLDDGSVLLSIYISNVSFYLDIMDLWVSFSERIATIYLPDRKRPMLPTILSDALCSLLEDNIRFAFTLDIHIKDSIIQKTEFKNTSIIVKKNYAYDSKELLKNKDYKFLFDIVTKMNMVETQEYINKVRDSHDVVAYLMVLMNFFCGKELNRFQSGIFRTIKLNEVQLLPKKLPDTVLKFIKGWNSSGGKYVLFHENKTHELLKMDAYVHITSPIRRLVDLLNILDLQDKLGLFKYHGKTREFYDRWSSKMDYINTTMRSIRRVQNDCSLLDRCIKEENPIYDGFLFDKMKRNDGLIQYMVFLPVLKMVNRYVTREEHTNYSKHRFKIYVFMDEDRLKQKVRIDIISPYNIYEKIEKTS